jgi:7,8-dihydropterin-6-yl-methyl-4-(beta-D-ribofuranosyl)aminobenzene 5'-phosphate synthase
MIENLTITQLVENAASSPGLLGEHGASFFIEADEHCLLLDTGQGLTLRHNAARLGIALERVTAVALSHGHYDHTGGLDTVIECTGGAIDLYLHPEALASKFNRDGRPIGSPITDLEVLRPRVRRLIADTGPIEIRPGIQLSGEIPRRHPIEDTGGPFYRDAARTEIDALPDDQALIIDTPAGLVVVLGCGHSGVINTLDHVRTLAPGRPIRAVLGGTHLLRASTERLDFTVRVLTGFGIDYLAPNHCTGLAATCLLRQSFPDQFHESPTGTRHRFGASA